MTRPGTPPPAETWSVGARVRSTVARSLRRDRTGTVVGVRFNHPDVCTFYEVVVRWDDRPDPGPAACHPFDLERVDGAPDPARSGDA